MASPNSDQALTLVASAPLIARLRAHLAAIARAQRTISYQALAVEMNLTPPNTIHQLTQCLEEMMREDALANRPLLAALVVSKRPTHLPQTGFFELAQALQRFDGDPGKRAAFHAGEVERAYREWAMKG